MTPVRIRKFVTAIDDVLQEGERGLERPLRRVAVGAVLENPWHGQPFVEDLQPEVREVAPVLVRALASRILDALGGSAGVEAFGKAALVGLDGELEHGAALIHTPYLGDGYRTATEGTSIIAFGDRRAGAGSTIVVPMWHKTAPATRSHYLATELTVPDAPRPNELVIVLAAASGPRPFARIGDRTTDDVELAGSTT